MKDLIKNSKLLDILKGQKREEPDFKQLAIGELRNFIDDHDIDATWLAEIIERYYNLGKNSK